MDEQTGPAIWRQWVGWVFVLWLGSATIVYVHTVVHRLRNPYNPGQDIAWALGFLGILIAVVLSSCLWRNNWMARFWQAAFGLLVLALVVLSGSTLPALISLWIGVVSWICGDWLLRNLGASPPENRTTWLAVTLPLGLSVLAMLTLALALIHQLGRLSALLMLLGLTAFSANHLRRILPVWRSERPHETAAKQGISRLEQVVLGLLLTWVFLLNLSWATAPDIQYDSLNYHLGVSRIYVERQGVVNLSYFFHSYLSHLVDMLFTLSLALQGQIVAKFIMLGMGVIAALSVYGLGYALSGPRLGAWSAALFYTTPLVSWLGTTTHTDLAVVVFLTGSLLAFLRWRETRQIGWLAVSGLLSGAAFGAKFTALYGLPVLGLTLLWDTLRARQPAWGLLKPPAVFIVSFLGVSLPWYAVVYFFTGNPIFPLLNAIFKSPYWPLENTMFDAASYGVGTSAAALLRLPFLLTVNSELFGEVPASLGVAPLILFPFGALLFTQKQPHLKMLLLTLAVYFLLWAFSFQLGRFLIPVLAVATVLALAMVSYLSGTRWQRGLNRVLLTGVLVAQVSLIPVQFWNIPERFPIALAFGMEGPDAFLSRALAPYRAAKYINTVVKPGQKVISVDADYIRFYLDAPLYSQQESLPTNDLPRLTATHRGCSLVRALQQQQFAYLLATRAAVENPQPWHPYLSPDFLAKFAHLEFSDENTRVYRLAAGSCND